VAAVLASGGVACSRSADDLIETARFEELQRNLPHARELYQQVIDRYPDSSEANEAKERLKVIGAAGGG